MRKLPLPILLVVTLGAMRDRACSRLFLAALALAALLAAPARAAPASLPDFTGYVVDAAGVIDPRSLAQITQLASQLDHAGLAQLAVCTVRELGDESKEEFAVDLFKKWGLGHGKKADGVLILLVPGPPGHRKIKVEVGYGMEGLLPDGKVGALLDRYAVPQLRLDAYGPAAASLSAALAQIIRDDAQAGGESAPPLSGMRGGLGIGGGARPGNARDADRSVAGLGLAVLAMGALLVLLLSSSARQRLPGARIGLAALALSGGAAAGLFLLGGAVGWVAFACGLVANALAFASIRSHKCPQCGGWMELREQIIIRPSVYSTGVARVTEQCTRCEHRRSSDKILPRRAPTVIIGGGGGGWSGGGGGWSGGGGGDGGGGFSGGGGGDSGGGGAGREV